MKRTRNLKENIYRTRQAIENPRLYQRYRHEKDLTLMMIALENAGLSTMVYRSRRFDLSKDRGCVL